jgi:hypothetical protein
MQSRYSLNTSEWEQCIFPSLFLDKDGLVPVMEPKVFVGPAYPEHPALYFQDFPSYQMGIRFDSRESDDTATFVTGAGRHIFEYEHALDVLMSCALRRRKSPNRE